MNNRKSNHLLCVDFESWIFSERINRKKLNRKELLKLDNGYTLKALSYILKTLKKYRQKITFFLVFKIEDLYPGTIEKILSEGHEVGWHTYTHAFLNKINILENELELSKKLLKKYPIKGFQAPNLTFLRTGYLLLKKYGFVYSSSIYGNSSKIYKFDGIYEIPVSVSNEKYYPDQDEIFFPSNMSLHKIRTFGIPFGSSFFWSILGTNYYKKNLIKNEKDGKTCNIFIHDWQLVTPPSKEYRKDIGILADPVQFPFFMIYRRNVSSMFEYLLKEFSFQTCLNYLKSKNGIKI